MLKRKEVVGQESYLEMFERKFTNFCEKNVLDLEFTIYPDSIEIKDHSGLMPNDIRYEFNFNRDVRVSISDIKDLLSPYYPKFIEKVERTFSNDEIKDLLRTHTPQEIENMKPEIITNIVYTVYRINNLHNEVNVIDHLDRNKRKSYKLFIPVMEFVNTLYTDKEKAYEIFKTKSMFVSEI